MSKVLPLPKLIEYFKIQFMQQFVQGLMPSSFIDTWTNNVSRNSLRGFGSNYILRNSNDLYLPTANLSSLEQHPYFTFPKMWHNFNNNDIKFIRDKLEFNFKLKNHFLNQLDANYRCTRLFCPHCSSILAPDSDS